MALQGAAHRTLYVAGMGSAVSRRRVFRCCKGYGACVSVKHGLLIVASCDMNKLYMFSLLDGSLVRETCSNKGGRSRYNGLCMSPDGDSVLVAEAVNNRVQEMRTVDGRWVRFVGVGVLQWPENVDCNAGAIVVSESSSHRISVFSWADGTVRAQFGSRGDCPGQLLWPRGIRLLADGSGVMVADCNNHRLCVFTMSGDFVTEVGSKKQCLCYPHDALECVVDGSFIVASSQHNSLIKVNRDGVATGMFRMDNNDEIHQLFNNLSALAAVPNDACFVLDSSQQRVKQVTNRRGRIAWMMACVCACTN